ncbi:hypothetical protein RFI_02693 [Reticulomyxa filosa]|uniref:NACHT domain-containing protein n=1 Tax=Reticulomyxa filosa TaxID=46433 RepID=X6P7B5_RETFI|nr:hypothetical protein RFI_02693 [Reticulomyxa filosa]|eukprot:ETO34400.1 hypothetical protein RFI_02693 [Reticulomyxa filosa]
MSQKKSESKILESTIKKLKEHYKSQNKLAPLFDDPDQLIDTCYIRLTLLKQRYFLEKSEEILNEEDNNEAVEEEKEEKDPEEWLNTLDYFMTYGSGQKTVELQDLWVEEKERERRKEDEEVARMNHISICGEAGSGKSVLTQVIAYLWAKNEMWSDQFQWLLHIPFGRIAHVFDSDKDSDSDNITNQWLKVMDALNISKWNSNDTKIVYSKNGLLILDGFDAIASELNRKPGLKRWLQHCTESRNCHVIVTSRPNVMCSYLKNAKLIDIIGFQSQDIRKYIHAYFQNVAGDSGDNDQKDCDQADILLRKLIDNPSLKLLSHIPLYLRLFCHLTRQQILKAQEEEDNDNDNNDNDNDNEMIMIMIMIMMKKKKKIFE